MANNKSKNERKELKRRLKAQRKEAKQERKSAKREEKLTRALTRREERSAVAYRSTLDRNESIELIEELLKAVKSGKVSIEHDGEQLSLEPAGVVDMRIRGRQSNKTESLTVRLRWPREMETENPAKLTVASN